ncbi:MAG: class I SAM-dependent methyltransferase [Nitrospirota bacterium]
MVSVKAPENTIQKWYDSYYQHMSLNRNDLLANPEVVFQSFALERSLIAGLCAVGCKREMTGILDVGCGVGGSLYTFLRLGFRPEQLTGIDILEERVADAHYRFPNIIIKHENAAQMSFPDDSFDITHESTMLVQILDDNVTRSIASEMIRVTKPNGYIIIVDWRYNKPGSSEYRAISPQRIAALFQVGTATKLLHKSNGALIPPVGRFLSKRMPSLYFLVQSMFPFLVGQTTTILQKI